MDIALLNVTVIFQKNEVIKDEDGNHINAWENFYSCYATVGGEGGMEKSVAGTTVDGSDLSLTVRYCKKTAEITNTGFRILFHGETYNILSVDHMNYKRKMLKFRCQKERR